MKYILKHLETDEEVEYSSLSQIARELDLPYSTVHKSYLYCIRPETKRGIKQSQKLFDKKYLVLIK